MMFSQITAKKADNKTTAGCFYSLWEQYNLYCIVKIMTEEFLKRRIEDRQVVDMQQTHGQTNRQTNRQTDKL
jgi:hypothetical protein